MPNGNIRYQLKTPYRDGATHVILEPLDFMARLATLEPRARVNLARYHGVFAPNRQHRAPMTWAQHLERMFSIDIHSLNAWISRW